MPEHLISPAPKNKRSLLFGRDDKLIEMNESLDDFDTRLIIITGLKKTGKTSLIKTVLSERKKPVLYLDVRDTAVSENIDRKETLGFFKIALQNFFNDSEPIIKKTMKQALQVIKGINISNYFGVDFDFSQEDNVDITQIFSSLNKWCVDNTKELVIVIDEVQYIKRQPSFDFSLMLASVYDNYDKLKIVLTGSEMGLLYDFLGDNDSQAPLNQKPRKEIELTKINNDTMIQFLIQGLKERGFTISQNEMNIFKEAVDILGSRIGWINEFGLECIHNKNIHKSYIADLKEKRKNSSFDEFNKFKINTQGEKYDDIMEYLANLDSQYHFDKYFANRDSTKKCIIKLINAGFLEKLSGKFSIQDKVLELNFINPNFEKRRLELLKEARTELGEN